MSLLCMPCFSSAAPLQQQCSDSTGYGACSLEALDHTWT